jgi:hypothetical protein
MPPDGRIGTAISTESTSVSTALACTSLREFPLFFPAG